MSELTKETAQALIASAGRGASPKPRLPNDINIAEVLNSIIMGLAPQDPLEHLENMYDGVSPMFIQNAVESVRERLAKLNNKKGTNEANVYFTLGQENATRSRLSGFVGGLLWLEDYVRSKGDQMGVTEAEAQTFTNVLRKMGTPQIMDALIPEGTKYTVRTYDAVIANYLLWLARGSVANTTGAHVTRSNKEVCDLITAGAMASYPAVPFTAYYLGTIKTNDSVLTLAEQMYKGAKFEGLISDEFSRVNEPKFVVTTSNAPIVNMVNHPLSVLTYGMSDPNSRNVNWFSAFSNSKEFSKLCAQNNTSPQAVARYMITNSPEQHRKNIQAGDPIAVFINNQKLTESIFEALKKSSGLLELAKAEYK